MRILLWAPFGAGTHYWGPGTSAYRLYKSNKNPLIKITLVHASEEQGVFPDVFIEQIKLPTLSGTGVIGKIKYFIAASKWINDNYNNYDVVHGITAFEYTFRPMLQFAKLGKHVYIKITSEYGGFGNNSRISNILGLARKRQNDANNISGYFALSNSIKKNLLKHNIDKQRVIDLPDGVDTLRFKPIDDDNKHVLLKKLNINHIFTFIYMGGLTFNKRIIEMVKAANILLKSNQNQFQLLIIGPDRSNGLVEKEINNLIENFNLQDLIVRIQHTENPELYYQLSNVFMLVSESEGLSNSLLEAMSSRLPAIVTDISGSQDMIKEGINGLYTTGEVYDIAAKMKWCLDNPKRLKIFGEFSRNFILENYSDKIILQKHVDLFSKTNLKI